VRFALVLGAALLAGSVAGADAREAAQVPPIALSSVRLDRDLVVMRADGTHRRVITLNGRDDSDPSWSPDGRRIAFSYYDGRRERVAVFELRSRRVRDLGEGFNPDWSPDGKRLVFLDAEGFHDLVVMNADGTGRRSLGLTNAGIADLTDPEWSPDGRRIAFVGEGLYVVDADGSSPRRIRPEGAMGSATWSPNGRRIAFDCQTRRFPVCLVRANGSGLRGLTRAGQQPNWSRRGGLIALTQEDVPSAVVLIRPDGRFVRRIRGDFASADWALNGRRLVAEHEIGRGIRLYAIDSAGRSIDRLTEGRHGVDQAPAWSPDGSRIAFRRRLRGRCSLAVLNVRPRRTRVLVPRTRGRFCWDRPDWSSRGRGIVYSSGGDLWTVPPRGGRPRRLTSSKVDERGPRWAPDGRSIGFVTDAGIWVFRPGGPRRLLVRDGGLFAWSRDGSALAYSLYNRITDQSDLFVQKEGEPARRLYEGIDGAPAWSPDGNRLAFAHTDLDPRDLGLTTLLVVDLAGRATEVIDDPTGDPDWRP
jgi:Tol biopolymer transport system component